MDNQPNNNFRPTTPEEPPLRQTPNMQNQQPTTPPPEPYETNPTPPELPTPPPKKSKALPIILAILAGLIVVGLVAGIIYWVTVLDAANDFLSEQNGSSQVEGDENITTISNVDELMAAYEAKSALNCSYVITMEEETFDVTEQADAGWQKHKIITVGDNTTTTTLALNGDAVYSWGYTTGGDEFAVQIPWSRFIELQNSELADQFNTEETIKEAKDSINGLVCFAQDLGTDYSVPERDWIDASAMLDALTSESVESILNEYSL